MAKAYRTGHAVYRLNYHFVWIPKYGRKVLRVPWQNVLRRYSVR